MVKGLALMAVIGVVAGLACAFTMQLLGFEGSSAVVGGVAGGVSGGLAPAIMRSRREARRQEMASERPDAKIVGGAPILLVTDVVASANYYRDRVGFSYDRFWGEPAAFCILERDGFHLMLSRVEDAKHVVPHYTVVEKMWNVYFWVDDAKALFEELKGRGATIDYELCEQPHGCLEFGIQDLDGYDIAFGQKLG